MAVNPSPVSPAASDTSWWPPHPKVAAAAVASPVIIIGAWVLSTYGHVDPPTVVTAAAVSLLTILVAYLVPGAE